MFNSLFEKFKTNTISAEDTKKRLEEGNGAILLDVRTPEEHSSIRIKGSVLVPLDKITSKIGKVVTDKDVEIIVYCHSGMRAKTAQNLLSQMGYTNVKNLGGINAWPYATVSGR